MDLASPSLQALALQEEFRANVLAQLTIHKRHCFSDGRADLPSYLDCLQQRILDLKNKQQQGIARLLHLNQFVQKHKQQ